MLGLAFGEFVCDAVDSVGSNPVADCAGVALELGEDVADATGDCELEVAEEQTLARLFARLSGC